MNREKIIEIGISVIGNWKGGMGIESLEIYSISRNLSNSVWRIYSEMGQENKVLFGRQLVRSVDSVGANIAEGFGRYHYLDSVKFYYNARGSLSEAKHWIQLLGERGLFDKDQGDTILSDMELLGKQLNGFINATKRKATTK